jgi:hypothetical protein
MSAYGTKRTNSVAVGMSAFDPKRTFRTLSGAEGHFVLMVPPMTAYPKF